MLVLVEKTKTFYAAHRVSVFGHEHKCNRLHGHSYTVTVWVKSNINHPVPFADAEAALDAIIGQWDHQCLNDFEQNLGGEPTTERVAAYIYSAMAGVGVHRVRVQETASSAVVVE